MARILIVDDRPANRELLVTLLRYAGHEIREAEDGERGLGAAREWHPDLIITDIVMPKMDGYEFAHQVRSDPAINNTQIIFYTSSYIVSETRRLAEACGVSIVIGKPIEPAEFLDQVRIALEMKQAPVLPPVLENFHREHMRVLTDNLVNKVEELEAEIAERKRIEQALSESERHYRQIVETAGEGVWVLDTENRTTFVNKRLADIFGYSQEEMMSSSVFDFMDPEDQVIAAASLERRRQGINEQLDFRYRRKDGSYLWALLETSTLLDSDGKYNGALAMLTDITERKQAEESLRVVHARNESVLASVADTHILFDRQWRYIYVNDAAIRGIGLSREQILGHTLWALYPDIVGTELERQYRRAMDERLEVAFEFHYLTRDSWWDNRFYPVPDGLAVFATNITERKQADERLRASEQRFRSLFEDSPICIWDEDFSLVKRHIDQLRADGVSDFRAYFASHPDEVMACASMVKIVDVNRAALEIYEADSRDDMLGSLGEITRPEIMAGFLDELLHVAGGQISFQWERTDYTLKGRPIEVNLSWSVAAGHEKDYSKVIVSAVDITERRRAELEIHRQLERLKALRTIDIAISSSVDLKLTLDVVLNQVVALLNVDAAAVLLLQPGINTLEYAASKGFRSQNIRTARINLQGGYAARSIRERSTVHVPNLLTLTGDAAPPTLFKEEGFMEYYCAPLLVKGEVKGALEILHRSSIHEDQQWFDFLETLAGQTAIAIENLQLFNGLQRSNIELSLAYDATIEGWSRALDLRDKETEGHSQRVTEMTLKLAQAMNVDDREIIHIRRGALLHDIGKLGVPDNILLKPGKLTDEEWEIMRQHPGNAYNMLHAVSYLRPALDIPYCHHEKWDGSGYPRGLKAGQIPLSARMFAIVDVWDALHSDRPIVQAGQMKRSRNTSLNNQAYILTRRWSAYFSSCWMNRKIRCSA
jgi:PAS domain S-box-containing protein